MVKSERLNVMTALPGALAAPVGLVVLLMAAGHHDNVWKIVSFSIYGSTLILLYVSTTLYHALQGKAKPVLQKIDHFAIYLLIAGTYTPFSLVILRGGWGWTLLGVVWGLAIFGIGWEMRPITGLRILPIVIYLAMGWSIVVAIHPLLQVFPIPGFIWLAAGGFWYTGGMVFYALDKRFTWTHCIWHLCVLAGSICHYLAVLLYVA